MNIGKLPALASLIVLGGCATSGTQVLQPYQLANGVTLQDVVTVGADKTGSAPVVTQVKTFRLYKGNAELVAQGDGSAPGMTSVVVSAVGGGVASGVSSGLVTRSKGVNNTVTVQSAPTAIGCTINCGNISTP